MIKNGLKVSVWCCLWVCVLLAASEGAVEAQTVGAFRIDYTVQVSNIEEQLFHVVADIRGIKEKQLDLSLPAWTPGWYTTENYAKNILRFKITDASGAPVPFTMTRKQTWRVETNERESVRVEFDYRATVLALNQAKITKDYAFFTGTQLFLMAEGHRASPSTVRFQTPSGWKIVSALKETADPSVYSASDYDTLVDAPTELGNFDVTRFEIEGKPHYFVANPAGQFSKQKTDEFVRILTQIAATQRSIFGDLPYEKYVYFYFFARSESNAGGALEHANSFVAFAPPAQFASPKDLAGTAAHEFFHLWNVKRIRPAEMWPYDYMREPETPLLWFSEGITNYYTQVTLQRSGLRNREQFLGSVAGVVGFMQSEAAASYISPASSSVSTWLCYDTPCAFQVSYYMSGQNLGALLDLSMLRDTSGAAGLDDVMRTLYRDFYQKGRGFSTEDMISVINRLTQRDYHDFFRRYVAGTETPRYEEIFGAAGLRLEKTTTKVPILDVEFESDVEGVRITHVPVSSPFAAAGVEAGDVLVALDGLNIATTTGMAAQRRLLERVGQKIPLTVKRAGKMVALEMMVASKDETNYKLTESPQATPEQLRVREAWLKTGNRAVSQTSQRNTSARRAA
ncbi:MAG TPA: PDZ domain-containing protein [Pyrinomonadaceae bacterium]